MKYLGWIISIILVVGLFYIYKTRYLPLKEDVNELREEISMWENILKGEKGIKGDLHRFPTDRFFENNKLTPYAEVEILRKFDMSYKGIEIYISAPKAFMRAEDLTRFLAEQQIKYQNLTLFVDIDSIERFEYKFIK